MPRFLMCGEPTTEGRVTFDAAQARHLGRVLRLGPGDLVTAVDGRGAQWQVRLTDVSPRSASGVVLGGEEARRESPLRLTLVQGLPKGDKMDAVVRMATELGAARIVPVLTSRTVVQPPAGGWTSRVARWQRIADEATKQCGRTVAPGVAAPAPLASWVAAPGEAGLVVCLWEEADAPLGSALPSPPVAAATLVVGPEGGLAADEVSGLRAIGAVVAGVGPRILRTETAGPVGLALLQARYGDLLERA